MDSPAIFGKATTPEDYLERGRWNYQADRERNIGSSMEETQEYRKTRMEGLQQDQSKLLDGLENMCISGNDENVLQETSSPYYEYALSTLVDFDGVVNRAGHDLRVSELASLHREIESSRLWLTDHQCLLGGLPLPATAKLGKLFERLKSTCEKLWDLPDRKQNRAVISCTESFKKAFNYLSRLVLFQSLLWYVELVDAGGYEDMRELVERLTETRVSETEFRMAAKETSRILRNVVALQDSVDAKARAVIDRMRSIDNAMRETLSIHEGTGHRVMDKVKSILKPTHAKDDKLAAPISARTGAENVYSSKQCFTTPPVPIAQVPVDAEPDLYNYNGQVVTRSAMELLEKEDQLAAKGGLFERDGLIMTASALSLLQAQEAMDRADSAGQGEYGPDTWDAIRGQYIPKWAKKLDPADQWPLVQEDGRMPIFYEDGTKMEDWYDVNLDVVEARNLQKFGIGGVVDHPY